MSMRTPRPKEGTRRSTKLYTQLTTRQIYDMYYERLLNLALSQFTWDFSKARETTHLDRRYMEMKYLTNGSIAVGKPEGVDKVVGLPWIQTTGRFDIYGYPEKIALVDFSGRQHPTDDWILSYDNSSRVPLISKLKIFSRDLALLHVVYRQNLRQQMTPFLVSGPQKLTSTIENIFDAIDEAAYYVGVDSQFDKESLQVLQTGVEFKGLTFFEARRQLWADALAVLGISAETNKKERLIADEIDLNRQEDTIAMNSRLMSRVELCKEMKERWDIEVTVNMNDVPVSFELDGNEDRFSEHSQDITVTETKEEEA